MSEQAEIKIQIEILDGIRAGIRDCRGFIGIYYFFQIG